METFLAAAGSGFTPTFNFQGSRQHANLILMFSYGYVAVIVLLHFCFAAMVLLAANDQTSKKEGLAFGNTFVWTLATLVGGVLVAAVYWAINHSILRPDFGGRPPFNTAREEKKDEGKILAKIESPEEERDDESKPSRGWYSPDDDRLK